MSLEWLRPIKDSTGNKSAEDWRPIFPFTPGRVYWQLDLDGRDAVEGIANYYLHDKHPGYFGGLIIAAMQEESKIDPARIALYTLVDTNGDDIAYAFASEESSFVQRHINPLQTS